MFFRSERLFLRPAWPEDWSDLFRRIADSRGEPGPFSAAWPNPPVDGAHFVPRPVDRRHPRLFITLPSMACGSGGSELIGCIGLNGGANGRPGEAELGYWITPERRGQGYATEAGRAMLAIARTLGHRRVMASAIAGDRASNRVLAKLGFRPSGTSLPRYFAEHGGVAHAPIHAIALTGAASADEGIAVDSAADGSMDGGRPSGGAMPFAA